MRVVLLGYNGLISSHVLTELVKHFKNSNNFYLICVGKTNSSIKNLKKINVVFIKKLLNYIQVSHEI